MKMGASRVVTLPLNVALVQDLAKRLTSLVEARYALRELTGKRRTRLDSRIESE